MTTTMITSADPRAVGGRYLSGYWRLEYTVTAAELREGRPWLTCDWADGRTTTHCTPWDPRRDQAITQP